MAYDQIIGRTQANGLIPTQEVAEVIQLATQESLALGLFRRIDLGTSVASVPVLSAVPEVFFVQGDTGLKQTTAQAWESVILNVEEIAVLVPVPDNVLADSQIDIWDELRPQLAAAIGKRLMRPASPVLSDMSKTRRCTHGHGDSSSP